MEVAGKELNTLTMDHHGLVASVCHDLGIAEKINKRLDKGDSRRVVSAGKAVVAMILNGLGFTNRRLYLTHQFFENKPTELLLNEDIQSSDITNYTLGHTLDEISAYSASDLFAEVAFETAIEHDLINQVNHLDSTSISVHGTYKTEDNMDEETPGMIKITQGFSKDHRPDLNQIVLSMVVNGACSFPLFMEPLDGNSSDKSSFHETIAKVREFQKQINLQTHFKWIADSALYTKDGLLKSNDYNWLTRVPETIKEAKALVQQPDEQVEWQVLNERYKIAPFSSNYGDIQQRWLLIFSQDSFEREQKTVEKNIKKKEGELTNLLWHLGNELFLCEDGAKNSLKKIEDKQNLFILKHELIPVHKYEKRGKPKAGELPILKGYKIKATYVRNEENIKKVLNTKGRFILATNDLDVSSISDEDMLSEYKQQQKVEGGFRFLKDPWFMVDSIFLKSPKRIEALMMVMTLTLMVYNVAQHKLREALKIQNETLPNQLNKPIQNPTMRWIFQLFEGVSIVQFYEQNILKPVRSVISNLNAVRLKIIRLFGNTACRLYGINYTSLLTQ
jgi:transposase